MLIGTAERKTEPAQSTQEFSEAFSRTTREHTAGLNLSHYPLRSRSALCTLQILAARRPGAGRLMVTQLRADRSLCDCGRSEN